MLFNFSTELCNLLKCESCEIKNRINVLNNSDMFHYICCRNSVNKLEFDKEMYQAFPIERDGKARNLKITTEC